MGTVWGRGHSVEAGKGKGVSLYARRLIGKWRFNPTHS
jgi:hypothetical protein